MIRRALSLGAVALLAACQTLPPPSLSEPRPVQRVREMPPEPTGPSDDSLRAALFYRQVEQRLLTDGLLRRDSGITDAPFDAGVLARNFERIALFSEYAQIGGRYVAQQSRAPLRRWEGPVRIQLHFGPSVDTEMRAADTRRVRSYIARLRRITGHPIEVVPDGGNYHVFVTNVDELAALG
ncbi:MAG: DUF2927 domain-containing protein, partial [Pseudomonadota bacterium]